MLNVSLAARSNKSNFFRLNPCSWSCTYVTEALGSCYGVIHYREFPNSTDVKNGQILN